MAGSAGDKEATAATAATAVFRAARDQLLALRGQHARALAGANALNLATGTLLDVQQSVTIGSLADLPRALTGKVVG